MPFPFLFFLSIVLLPSALVAAGADQAAAKLNGVTITEVQVDYASRRSGSASQPERQADLERLITQQLFAEEAVRKKIDQDVRVIAALKAARNEILAQAYRENEANNAPRPTATMVQAYYDAHPALFSERAVYKLQEINIQPDRTQSAAVIDRYNRIKTLDDMVEWLKLNNIPYKTGVTVKSAEELPADLLEPVSQLQEGQVIKVTTDPGIAIVQLTGKRTVPVTISEAKPDIERFLTRQTLGEQMARTASRLRKEATVEYYPPYTPM